MSTFSPILQQMAPKRSHFVPSNQQLQALLRAYEGNEDFHMVGRALGMSRRTVDRNIQRFEEEGRRQVGKPGKPHPKWDDEMLEYAVQMV